MDNKKKENFLFLIYKLQVVNTDTCRLLYIFSLLFGAGNDRRGQGGYQATSGPVIATSPL